MTEHDDALERVLKDAGAHTDGASSANGGTETAIALARMLREDRRTLLEQLGPVLAKAVVEGMKELAKDEAAVSAFFSTGYDVLRQRANNKIGDAVITTGWGVVRSKLTWALLFMGAVYYADAERIARALGAAMHEFIHGPH